MMKVIGVRLSIGCPPYIQCQLDLSMDALNSFYTAYYCSLLQPLSLPVDSLCFPLPIASVCTASIFESVAALLYLHSFFVLFHIFCLTLTLFKKSHVLTLQSA